MDAPKKTEPRARILEVADRLFYGEGIRATGTERIMALSNVAKATFYHHFKSKDALVLSYLENRDQAFWRYLFDPAPPKDIHETLFRLHGLVNHPQTIGCPFLRAASEFPDTAHPFHIRVIEHKNRLLNHLADQLKGLVPDARESAAKLLMIIDGALSDRMLYGIARDIALLTSAEAILSVCPPQT